MPLVDDFAKGMKAAIERMGQTCTIDGKSIYAILENDFQEVQFSELAFESNEPMLIASTENVPTVVKGSTVVFDGVTYVVAEMRPQTGGVTEMRLRETV